MGRPPPRRLLYAALAFLLLAACAGPLADSAPPGLDAPGDPPTPAGEPVASTAEPAIVASSPSPAPPEATPTATAMQPTPPPLPSPTLPPGPPTATPALRPRNGGRHIVLAYYVPYDPTSWQTLQARADALDFLAAQWVTADACGGVTSRDDRTLLAFARERGLPVLPSLLTSSGSPNHKLLTDGPTTDHYLDQIVAYVVELGYPGLDLDMEGIDAADRDAYTAFVTRLAEALHRRGKLLTLAIPGKTTDVRTGWAGPYDYAALGRQADLILIMSYEYSYPGGPPGSIAPANWVERVTTYAASQIPPEKLLVGVSFYGYDWNVTSGGRARSVLYPQAAALARQYGVPIALDLASLSATFAYTAGPGDRPPSVPRPPALQHDISVRAPPRCVIAPPPVGPTATPQPTPLPPSGPQQHVVWLEDANSLPYRLDVAVRHGTAGVGAWRLGEEDPSVWPKLTAWRGGG